MRKIYFNNRVINFDPESELIADFNIKNDSSVDVTKMLQKLEFSNSITINGDNIEAVYSKFCSFFKLVDAAGGVVVDKWGKFLMIERNGRWDLPKGHRELGEEVEECAVREVEEECGVKGLKITKYLTTTKHIYELDGVWILKSTHWYSMMSDMVGVLTPQVEEGITQVRWVDRSEAKVLIKGSFKTIQHIFINCLHITVN